MIRKRYLMRWFPIDVVGSFPGDTIFFIIDLAGSESGSQVNATTGEGGTVSNQQANLLTLFKILKVPKLMRLGTRAQPLHAPCALRIHPAIHAGCPPTRSQFTPLPSPPRCPTNWLAACPTPPAPSTRALLLGFVQVGSSNLSRRSRVRPASAP